MLHIHFAPGSAKPASHSAPDVNALRNALWLDLLDPVAEETRNVEQALKLQLPTRKEAQEIEMSSRLYTEDATLFMTATVMVGTETPRPTTTPVTFAYQPRRLLTLRFADPTPFPRFAGKFERSSEPYGTAQRVFTGLIDEIVDRVADILESVAADLNEVSGILFSNQAPGHTGLPVDYTSILTRIGHNGERAANARESLVSLGRIATYFAESLPGLGGEPLDDHWNTIQKDILALTDHATFVSNKVNFFLDATLGRINIEQNTIIKLFSVLAVIFLPPTLIASIYGMNFEHQPELKWEWGYPMSIVLMIAAAILPYWIFKRKGWL